MGRYAGHHRDRWRRLKGVTAAEIEPPEADDVSKRLKQHAADASKDFWEYTVVITSKDANLTKAHGLYLESQLIKLAHEAGRSRVHNSTNPDRANLLPEADISDMMYFLQQALLVLPLLGVDAFRAKPNQPEDAQPKSEGGAARSPVFRIKTDEVDATGQEIDGEFIVYQGSVARPWLGASHAYAKHQRELVEANVLRPDGPRLLFSVSFPFRSVSAAAAAVLGRAANGRTEWISDETGTTFRDWQDSLLVAEPN